MVISYTLVHTFYYMSMFIQIPCKHSERHFQWTWHAFDSIFIETQEVRTKSFCLSGIL